MFMVYIMQSKKFVFSKIKALCVLNKNHVDLCALDKSLIGHMSSNIHHDQMKNVYAAFLDCRQCL